MLHAASTITNTTTMQPRRRRAARRSSHSSPARSPNRSSPSRVWPPLRHERRQRRHGARVAERGVEGTGLGQQVGRRRPSRRAAPLPWPRPRRAEGTTAMRRARRSTNGHSSSGGQRPVHPPPPLGQFGRHVVATEDDLQRPRPADEPRQAHRAAAAGQDAQRDLGLVEHGPAERGEAHVAAERQLAAAATHAPLDRRRWWPSAWCGTPRTSRGSR